MRFGELLPGDIMLSNTFEIILGIEPGGTLVYVPNVELLLLTILSTSNHKTEVILNVVMANTIVKARVLR